MSFSRGDLISSGEAKALAVSEAARGLGFVSPNPAVGCVVVDNKHHFLSSGYHHKFGGNHAEIDATDKLSSEDLVGATVYVTLEPCAHEGKTPSCAKRLAKEKIKTVVCGLLDPNPLVAGQGFEILKSAGITVIVDDEFGESCREVTEIFLWSIKGNKPFVTLKVACSSDGYMTDSDGVSKWITNERARFEARKLRAHHDATLVGAGTLIKDDPILNFRDTKYSLKKNKIVIWDPKGKSFEFLKTSRLFEEHGRENIYILSPNLNSDFQVFQCSEITDGALNWLYDQGISSLFVEGGAYAFRQFLKPVRFQRLYVFMSQKIFGDGLLWDGGLSKDLPMELAWEKDIQGDSLKSFKPHTNSIK